MNLHFLSDVIIPFSSAEKQFILKGKYQMKSYLVFTIQILLSKTTTAI